jgi:hypothetical protein
VSDAAFAAPDFADASAVRPAQLDTTRNSDSAGICYIRILASAPL